MCVNNKKISFLEPFDLQLSVTSATISPLFCISSHQLYIFIKSVTSMLRKFTASRGRVGLTRSYIVNKFKRKFNSDFEDYQSRGIIDRARLAESTLGIFKYGTRERRDKSDAQTAARERQKNSYYYKCGANEFTTAINSCLFQIMPHICRYLPRRDKLRRR